MDVNIFVLNPCLFCPPAYTTTPVARDGEREREREREKERGGEYMREGENSNLWTVSPMKYSKV